MDSMGKGRGVLNHKENRRTQMTRQLLRDSLVELLEQQELHKISVRALCQRAEVNRSTFYRYYDSPFELLREIEDVFLQQVQRQLAQGKSDRQKEPVAEILSFCARNQRVCRVLLNSNVSPDFPIQLLHLPAVVNWMNETLTVGSEQLRAYIQEGTVYGAYQIAKRWINRGCLESPEEIAQIVYYMFPGSRLPGGAGP